MLGATRVALDTPLSLSTTLLPPPPSSPTPLLPLRIRAVLFLHNLSSAEVNTREREKHELTKMNLREKRAVRRRRQHFRTRNTIRQADGHDRKGRGIRTYRQPREMKQTKNLLREGRQAANMAR